MPRVVLVTGCSTGGIGYSLYVHIYIPTRYLPTYEPKHRCEEFARQGCKVYATSRRVETIADFAEGSNIEKFQLDVNSDESVSKIIEHIAETDGKLDVLVNNAGVIAPGISISRFHISCICHSIFQFQDPSLRCLLKMLNRDSKLIHFPCSVYARPSCPLWRNAALGLS